jgi:hypothetical protein
LDRPQIERSSSGSRDDSSILKRDFVFYPEERDKAATTDSWKKLHVTGVWVGVAVSLFFSVLPFYQGFSDAAATRKIKVDGTLDEVWRL